MNNLQDVSQYSTLEFIVFALFLGVIISFLTSIIALRKQSTSHQKPFITTGDNNDIIANLQNHITSLENKINEVHIHTPQTALVRFNPFRDSGVGGNQSFCLASITPQGNGFIITHLFSREMSRVSTKQITNWTADLELSPEEKQALSQVKNNS